MKLEIKQNCPLDSFNPCRELECAWFMKLQGKNPNDGKDIDEWGCAMSWLPILLVENAQQSRSTGAAVESFRNEMVVSNAENIKALITTAQIQSEIQSKKQLKIVE